MTQQTNDQIQEKALEDLRLLADSGNLRLEGSELVFLAENQSTDERPFSFEELLDSSSYELTAEQVGKLRHEVLSSLFL